MKFFLSIITVILLGFFIQFVFPNVTYLFGLVPRTVKGLTGIIGMHFLHGGISHLISNLSTLIPVLGIVLFLFKKEGKVAVIIIPLIAGLLLWMFGRSANHIGASAWVYGIIAFLVSAGFFTKKVVHILVGTVIAIFYSGLIYGILPGNPGISFEGHLFGIIAGIFVARLILKKEHETV